MEQRTDDALRHSGASVSDLDGANPNRAVEPTGTRFSSLRRLATASTVGFSSRRTSPTDSYQGKGISSLSVSRARTNDGAASGVLTCSSQ